jgi:hypothetical protein
MSNQIYAIYFPTLIYNCPEQSYQISGLPDSLATEGRIFSYVPQSTPLLTPMNMGMVAVALKLSRPLTQSEHYKTIERIKNLLILGYTTYVEPVGIETQAKDIDVFVQENAHSNFYAEGTRFNSTYDDDTPLRIAQYTSFVAKLKDKDSKKFWQALQTFSNALLLGGTPNPQYKFTIELTLLLASINQLADEPKPVHKTNGDVSCATCGVLGDHKTSHISEIKKLVEKRIDSKHSPQWIELVDRLFHKVRSRHIHHGDLFGYEDIGGFIALWNEDVTLMEDIHNTIKLARILLEQHLAQLGVK